MEKYRTKIVIPAYNEEKRIKAKANLWTEITSNYECILVDDGSTDGTADIAKEFGFHTVIRHDKNKGKGAAVRTGILKALELGAGAVLFADADLSAGPESWERVLEGLKEADVVIGSRAARGAEVRHGILRKTSSKAFQLLQRTFLSLPVLDTQCGCKAFTRAAAEKLFLPDLRFPGYGFDLEILSRAVALGMKIKEVGIKWVEEKGSKVHLIKDSIRLALTIYELKKLKKTPFLSSSPDDDKIKKRRKHLRCLPV